MLCDVLSHTTPVKNVEQCASRPAAVGQDSWMNKEFQCVPGGHQQRGADRSAVFSDLSDAEYSGKRKELILNAILELVKPW